MILFLLLRLVLFAWFLGPEPDERGPRTLGPGFSEYIRRLYSSRKSTFGRG